MERTRSVAFLVILLLPFISRSQHADTITTTANKKRLSILIGGSSLVYGASLVALGNLWYSNSKQQSFHFFNDDAEWKQMDKLGHFYSAFYVSYAGSRALRWANVEQNKSNLIGSLTGFLVTAPIEILDGFSSAYGASVGDLAADAGGSVFYYAQATLWKEPRIYPKLSFHTTHYAALRPNVLGDTWSSELLKDYNGQTHWWSFDMDKFMPFPKWLNLAVGYGAQGMVYARDEQNRQNGYNAYRQYYLAIDFDLTSIKTKSKFVRSLIFVSNMIKIPAPTIEFSKKGISYYGFYF
ncbi:MAG TPA: DUF2279 domain-containing protein [Cyclobacteriaceae bacterium]